ncbi:hypothetical protein BTHE68_10600 [Burkholderia sp. THE68]|nr:hypothetical protein BTHE68_10600 [Burkholderia sp. THE68]
MMVAMLRRGFRGGCCWFSFGLRRRLARVAAIVAFGKRAIAIVAARRAGSGRAVLARFERAVFGRSARAALAERRARIVAAWFERATFFACWRPAFERLAWPALAERRARIIATRFEWATFIACLRTAFERLARPALAGRRARVVATRFEWATFFA